MPSKSQKQRRWAHANEPEMAEKWERESKRKPKKKAKKKKPKK